MLGRREAAPGAARCLLLLPDPGEQLVHRCTGAAQIPHGGYLLRHLTSPMVWNSALNRRSISSLSCSVRRSAVVAEGWDVLPLPLDARGLQLQMSLHDGSAFHSCVDGTICLHVCPTACSRAAAKASALRNAGREETEAAAHLPLCLAAQPACPGSAL